MTLKRDKEQFIPDFAKQFVEEINRARLKKGNVPLQEEELKKLIDRLEEIRENY